MAFFNSAVTVLQTLVIALGAGLGMPIPKKTPLQGKIRAKSAPKQHSRNVVIWLPLIITLKTASMINWITTLWRKPKQLPRAM